MGGASISVLKKSSFHCGQGCLKPSFSILKNRIFHCGHGQILWSPFFYFSGPFEAFEAFWWLLAPLKSWVRDWSSGAGRSRLGPARALGPCPSPGGAGRLVGAALGPGSEPRSWCGRATLGGPPLGGPVVGGPWPLAWGAPGPGRPWPCLRV